MPKLRAYKTELDLNNKQVVREERKERRQESHAEKYLVRCFVDACQLVVSLREAKRRDDLDRPAGTIVQDMIEKMYRKTLLTAFSLSIYLNK